MFLVELIFELAVIRGAETCPLSVRGIATASSTRFTMTTGTFAIMALADGDRSARHSEKNCLNNPISSRNVIEP